MAGSLFNKAKAAAAPKAANPKDSKTRIAVKDGDFFDKIQTLEKLNDNLKRDKAKADMLSDEIKEISKSKWIELYEKTGRYPGSVMVESKKGIDLAQTMFIPMDKYITINKDRAEALIEEYGDDIVEEKTTFSFDNDMIEKYGEVISRLIEDSDEIEDDDKGKIVKAVQAFAIAKGTIERLKDFGSISTMMDVVKPVVSLKNVEVIKG